MGSSNISCKDTAGTDPMTTDRLDSTDTLDIIATGGTIDMAGSESRKPSSGINSLLSALEPFTKRYRLHTPFNTLLDSTNIGPSQWECLTALVRRLSDERLALVERINRAPHVHPVAGIVITHGTDTLQETGLILALESAVFHSIVPIVLTCASSPPSEPGSDALRNLILASIIAQSYLMNGGLEHEVPPGLYVLVGTELHLAARIKKVSTSSANDRSYVESVPGPIGHLSISHKSNLRNLNVASQVRLRLQPILPIRKSTISAMNRDKGFGYVEHLWFKRDTPLQVLSKALARSRATASRTNLRTALVLQGDFSRKADNEIDEIATLIKTYRKGRQPVAVFTGSPKVWVRIKDICKRNDVVFIIPKSLSHSKARTKLAWLLQFKLTPAKLAHRLRTDISGECFQLDILPDWIAGESYGPNNDLDPAFAKRVVICFPGMPSEIIEEAHESLERSTAKKRELNIIGFGDGNIPIGNITVTSCTRAYLQRIYGLDMVLATSSTYLTVEREMAFYVRYNEDFRREALRHYALSSGRELAHELFRIGADHTRMKREHWIEYASVELIKALSSICQLPKEQVNKAIRYNPALIDALLHPLYRICTANCQVNSLSKTLDEHGIDFSKIPGNKGEFKPELTAEFIPELEDWLQGLSPQELSEVCRVVPDVLARRVIRDAVANSHPILKRLVVAVDHRIKVNIKTNAGMGRTDSRKYELGNLLLVAGADSDEVRGWSPGPFTPLDNF